MTYRTATLERILFKVSPMNTSLLPKRLVSSLLFKNFGLKDRISVRQSETNILALNQGEIAPMTIGDKSKLDLGQGAIAAFGHYRDAKVVIEDLVNAGLPLGWITLISRDSKYHDWMPGLKVCDRLEEIGWEVAQENQCFRQLFKQGKYLIAVAGSNDAIHCAKAIFQRKRALRFG